MSDAARRGTWVVAVVVVAGLTIGVVAPLAVGWRLETVIAQAMGGHPQVDVQVRASPWGLVAGSLIAVDVTARGARLGQLPVSSMILRLRAVEVGFGRLVRGDPGALSRVDRGDGDLVLSRADLEGFLASVKGMQRAEVGLQAGVVTIEGDVRVGSLDLRARLEGRLVVASPTTVDLYVQTLTVSGVEIPREIGGVLVSSLNPLISLEGLPVPLRIESVAVEDDQVRMTVRVVESSS